MKNKIVSHEIELLIYNNFDIDFALPFNIISHLSEFVQHENLDLILLKANNFLNDIYRSYLCVCFKPNEIAAAALFMSLLFLKIKLSSKNFLCQLDGFDSDNLKLDDVQYLPWKFLFDAEAPQVWCLAETSYKFLKLVK